MKKLKRKLRKLKRKIAVCEDKKERKVLRAKLKKLKKKCRRARRCRDSATMTIAVSAGSPSSSDVRYSGSRDSHWDQWRRGETKPVL